MKNQVTAHHENDEIKYNIQVNSRQASIISLALDMISRMEGGQLTWVFSMIPWKNTENINTAIPIIAHLQQLLTGIDEGSLGIGNVSERSKIAYDLHQVIRHQLAIDRDTDEWNCDLSSVRQYGNEPLATIEKLQMNERV